VGGWDEFGLVEKALPGTVGLPANHLRATVRPITRWRGRERDVTTARCHH
jgi:hypothetical protein